MKYLFVLLFIWIFSFLSFRSYKQKDMRQKALFNHLAIYVSDLHRSADFYENIVGLDTIPEPFHDGKHAWFKTGPANSLHIIQGAETKKEYYKNNHICFSVPSVDMFTDMLKQKAIPFEDATGTKNNKINIRPDGIKQVWLQDPDGYWIEINDAKE